MPKILIILFTLFLGNTTNSCRVQQTEEASSLEVQRDMLVGEFQPSALEAKPFASWFIPAYENFTPDEEALTSLQENIKDHEIVVFMGTWCGDSQRETPKFLKLLDDAGYDMKNLTMIGVDYSKSTPNAREKEYNIERVPTIIFLKDGQEVNRFVEYPVESLEEDVANIVGGKEYINPYSN